MTINEFYRAEHNATPVMNDSSSKNFAALSKNEELVWLQEGK
jgi:hypothetical protein